MWVLRRFIAVGLLLGAWCVCARADRPRVLTTFLPLTAHTLAIAGDDAEVVQLLAHGVGAHDYQMRPSDMRRVAEADVIIVNGLGLEAWIEPLIRKSGKPTVRIVDTSAGMETLQGGDVLQWRSGAGGTVPCDACGDHSHAGGNPHVWLDPLLARLQARAIADALKAAAPESAAGFEARFIAYAQRLDALHASIERTLEPVTGATLVTFHDAFPYFARRYGLHYAGALEAFPGREPSPRELAALVRTLRAHNVSVIFSEQGYDPSLLETLARQSGARIAQLDTLELGEPGPSAYIDGMRRNARVLAEALGQGGVAAHP